MLDCAHFIWPNRLRQENSGGLQDPKWAVLNHLILRLSTQIFELRFKREWSQVTFMNGSLSGTALSKGTLTDAKIWQEKKNAARMHNHFLKLQKKYDIVWHCKHVFIVCTVTFIYKKSIQSISRLCKRTAVLKYRPMTATPVYKATIPRLLFLPLKKRARELYKRNTGSSNSHSPGCLLQHTVGNTPAQWTGAELWEITTTTKKSIPPSTPSLCSLPQTSWLAECIEEKKVNT